MVGGKSSGNVVGRARRTPVSLISIPAPLLALPLDGIPRGRGLLLLAPPRMLPDGAQVSGLRDAGFSGEDVLGVARGSGRRFGRRSFGEHFAVHPFYGATGAASIICRSSIMPSGTPSKTKAGKAGALVAGGIGWVLRSAWGVVAAITTFVASLAVSLAGKACGACHNGRTVIKNKTIFHPKNNCKRCHSATFRKKRR